MSRRLTPGHFPPRGAYLRRGRDGMLGLVRGDVRNRELAPGITARDMPIWWIDEPGISYLAAERGDYDLLDGPDEEAAAREAFAPLICGACGGRGSTPEAICPESRCTDGRLLGVRDGFDTAEQARSAAHAVRPERANNDYVANRELELRFASKCEVCGKQLEAGVRARGGKVHGRWGFSCLEHKS